MSDAAQPTAAEVRAAASVLKAAIDRHLEAVERRSGEEGSAVYAAFEELAAAAEAYDEVLYEVHDEVTPFEIPSSDTLPAYTGPDEPGALSVLIRRDYTVAEPHRLLAQAQRIADLDPDVAGGEDAADREAVGSSVTAAVGVLFGEFEPDEIASRHREFGLSEGDSAVWVAAAEEPAEPGEWLSAPFDQVDPELVICRFDVSASFDDELDFDADDADDEDDEDEDDEDDEDEDTVGRETDDDAVDELDDLDDGEDELEPVDTGR